MQFIAAGKQFSGFTFTRIDQCFGPRCHIFRTTRSEERAGERRQVQTCKKLSRNSEPPGQTKNNEQMNKLIQSKTNNLIINEY